MMLNSIETIQIQAIRLDQNPIRFRAGLALLTESGDAPASWQPTSGTVS